MIPFIYSLLVFQYIRPHATLHRKYCREVLYRWCPLNEHSLFTKEYTNALQLLENKNVFGVVSIPDQGIILFILQKSDKIHTLKATMSSPKINNFEHAYFLRDFQDWHNKELAKVSLIIPK
jgi:predicted sulfurtransferase